MKHLKFLSLIMMMLFIISACHKTTIVVPEACMTLSDDTLHLSDTLTVYNCSKSEGTFITFTDSTNANPDSCNCQMTGYNFDQSNKITHVFSHPGTNYVYLQAWNENAPIKTMLLSVIVIP